MSLFCCRLFCFDEEPCRFTPLGSSNEHDCCLLSVTSFNVTFDPEVKQRRAVLTGGTDGRIALWDVDEAEQRGVKLLQSACGNDEMEDEEEDDQGEEDGGDGDDDVSHSLVNTTDGSGDNWCKNNVDQNSTFITSSLNLPTLDTSAGAIDDVVNSTANCANASLGSSSFSQGACAMPSNLPQSNPKTDIGNDPRTTEEKMSMEKMEPKIVDQDLKTRPRTSNMSTTRTLELPPPSVLSQESSKFSAETEPSRTAPINEELPDKRLVEGCQVTTAPGQVISAWTAHQSGINALAATHVTGKSPYS